MKKFSATHAVAPAIVAVLLGTTAQARTVATVDWNGGTKIADGDKGYAIKFGGRIMNDWTSVGADDSLRTALPDIGDGTEFRRVRLFTSGTIYRVVVFKSQFDFSGGEAKVKDMYVGVKNIPLLGTIKAGHMYEPFGLEEQTSSKVITFMERALTSSLTPSRKTGVMFTRTLNAADATIAAGVFRPTNGFGSYVGNKYNFTVRATAVPYGDAGGHTLVHVGAAASVRDPDGAVRYRARPENHISPRFADTGGFDADRVVLVGGEAAVVFGPASVQGEYVAATTDAADTGDPTMTTYYVQGSWLLTGENRGYKRGVMGGVRPARNFDGEGGAGAWELGVRFSTADFEDGALGGGQLSDVTVGLNWYLNAYTRVMVNYVRGDLNGVGVADQFMARFQVAF